MPPRKEENEELEVNGPAGIKATLRGPVGQLALIAVLCVLLLGLYVHETDTKARQATTVQEVRKVEEHIKGKFDEVIYVLSLRQEDREKLNLSMPDGIREKRRNHVNP